MRSNGRSFRAFGSCVIARRFRRRASLLETATRWLRCVALFVFSKDVWAIDLVPGELRPLTPGTSAFQLTYGDSLKSGLYQDGEAISGDRKVEVTLYRLRVVKYSELSGHPSVVAAQLPGGAIRPGGDLNSLAGDRGVGDATFIYGIWPLADWEKQRFLAVAAYLALPTGSYSAERSFNVGENRARIAWQVGYQAPIGDKLFWMGAVDATYYETNSDFGPAGQRLSRLPLVAWQVAMRYQWTQRFAVAAGYFYTVGGETALDGRSRDDALRTQRYQVSGFTPLSQSSLATVQYGQDLSTENGFREAHQLVIRYTKMF